MRTNTLVALIAVALVSGSSIAMAKGGGGGGGIGHGGISHGRVGHHFHRFLRNQVFFGVAGAGAGAGVRTPGMAQTRRFLSSNLCRAFRWQA
jgi:hypothetical protein